MKGVWTCTGCGRRIKSVATPKVLCECPSHPGGRGWASCQGRRGRPECEPGACYQCDRDREFLATK